VINLVLSEDDKFPFSEERRTFYVGLSRAKKHTYLLADRNRISTFIQEILDDDYNFEILGESPRLIPCPECKKGIINRITRDGFDFFSCNRYDLCNFRREPCPECKDGVQYLENESDELFTCSNPNCSHQAIRCPDCNEYLVLREGNPDFYGCINFGKTGCRSSQQIPRVKELSENLEKIRQFQLSQKSIDYEKEFFNYLKTQNVVNMITATERLTTFGFKYEEAKELIEKWILEGKIENSGFKGIRLITNE
jgi:ssDNA-binding Zn-finger/Zn-ribbon topoisomerase 1